MTQPATGFGGASSVEGGASYAGNPFGPSITGPNAAAYNGLLAGANAASAGYAQQGANYTQAAPTIANPYQAGSQQALAGTNAGLTGLEGTLMQTAAGQGPAIAAAQAQMQGATDQNIAAQTAMARSATGGALAQQGAQLAGQGNIASTLGQAASSSANTLAQQQLAAAQAAGSVYGTQGGLQMNQYQLEQQQAQQQAQLASVSQGQQNQQQLGLIGASQNASGQALNALNSYGNQNLAAQGLAQSGAQQGFGDAMQIGQTAAGAASGGLMSDARAKTDITSESDEPARPSMADDFLSRLKPASYNYRDTQDEPTPGAGGRYLGVMAQALEGTQGAGRSMVKTTPRGKMIEPKATLSAALAGIGRLHERLQALEGGRRA